MKRRTLIFRTPFLELFDLTLTQSIDRYSEMERDEAIRAIATEWPEQMSIILDDFLFKTTCGQLNGMTHFVQIPRVHGHSNYFVPVCTCERGKI